MDSTISALIDASGLPLSVLIVGVGQADFSNMNALDGDNTRLRSGARVARRDIVQFVALKDHVQAGRPLTADNVGTVSRELLAEIPGQLLEYMSMSGVTPNPSPMSVAGTPGPYAALAPPATAHAVPPPPAMSPVAVEHVTAYV